MPTYNGQQYIRQALDSLLAQMFKDFELIISDNASTDSTQAICLDYASRDERIRYFRNETNVGAVKNFERVLKLSSGEYFMWAADDDIWSPQHISLCVQALTGNLSAVLCATSTIMIDQDGHALHKYEDEDLHTVGLDKLARLEKTITRMGRNCPFYGLMKREIAIQIPLRNVYGYDHLFTAELATYGEFIILPQTCFYSRIGGDGSSTLGIVKSQQINSLFVRCCPNLAFFFDFVRTAAGWRMLNQRERLDAIRLVTERFLSRLFLKRMLLDVPLFARDIYREIGKKRSAGKS